MDLFNQLHNLAEERANQYPLKDYPGKQKFKKKLSEFADLIIKQSENVQINEQALSLCEKFRNNPVFICGYYKTGTSLLNSLLDFHPQAVVLLPGSKILFGVNHKAEKLSQDEFFNYLAREYIQSLYNPTGHLPIDLLDSMRTKKYTEFVAYLRYFIKNANNKKELLSALPCALFFVNGQFERGDIPAIWVEKSVTNERHIKTAKQIFPNAKFIYIARNPYDNLASIKRWYINSGRKNVSSIYMYFTGLKKSLQNAEENQSNNFISVKYEDIVQNTENEIKKIANFLNINHTDSMQSPTIIGIPDRPNTSDTKEKNREASGVVLTSRVSKYKQTLTQREIKNITIIFSELIKKLGYQLDATSSKYKFLILLPLKLKVEFSTLLLRIRNRI